MVVLVPKEVSVAADLLGIVQDGEAAAAAIQEEDQDQIVHIMVTPEAAHLITMEQVNLRMDIIRAAAT
jgi:hypothetical protein